MSNLEACAASGDRIVVSMVVGGEILVDTGGFSDASLDFI
jgi:hypothetical protein